MGNNVVFDFTAPSFSLSNDYSFNEKWSLGLHKLLLSLLTVLVQLHLCAGE